MNGFWDVFSRRLPARESSPCLIVPGEGRRYTYAEMEAVSNRVAHLLRRCGVGPGDRVVLALANVPEFFHCVFAAAKLGAIAVPVDPDLKPPEIAILAAHCEPKACVTGPESAWRRAPLPGKCARLVAGAAAEGSELSLDAEAAREPAEFLVEQRDPESPFILFYTSGTTGAPKGVLHSHATLRKRASAMARAWGLDESQRVLCVLPLHFIHAVMVNSMPSLVTGGSLVLSSPKQVGTLSRLMDYAKEHKVHGLSVVPTMLRVVMQFRDPKKAPDAGSVRFVTSASAPLPPELIASFEAAYGVSVVECYGLTETSIATMTPRDVSRRAPGSVGKALECEVRIVGPDGLPVPAGQAGEIAIKGCLMMGYYQRPDLTARTIRDGWLHTGDIGALDADGNLFLRGRIKEVIIRAGAKVFPKEVDELLGRHPAVLESYTIGAPDELRGERAVSYVALRPGMTATAPELDAHCREALADYKCPDDILFADSIPKNSRGKPDRRELESWVRRDYGGE